MFYKIKINGYKLLLTNPNSLINSLYRLYVYIPRFCYVSTLSIASNCRMCLIEIEKGEKLILSCAFPFYENINLITKSPKVQKARESILEFLLLNHPLDCPICDQGGECDLQNQTSMFSSINGKKFIKFKTTLKSKFFGYFLNGIMTRCIQCTKCIRLSINILYKINTLSLFLKYNSNLGSINRGNLSAISNFYNNYKNWYIYFLNIIKITHLLNFNLKIIPILKTIRINLPSYYNMFYLFLTNICPVGALNKKNNIGITRSWDINIYNEN